MRIVVGSMAVLVLAAPLLAKSAAPDRPAAVIQKIEDCRGIAADAARLACYDDAARGLAEATARKDIVVLDREAVKETRKGLFGFSLPHLPFFGGGTDKHGNDKEQINEIDLVIKSVTAMGDKFRLVMDDGSTWETVEPMPFKDPKAGQKIHIERGALGNYFMKPEGGRAVRGRRTG